jgi:CheY-like chemotaxis protein
MKTVLIADDETALLELYDEEFRRAGYQVKTAPSAREALEIIENQSVDCVVMDIKMPGEDGLDAVSEIRKMKNDIPIVLNTAYSSYKNDFHTWLADAYVVKSPDISELLETVDRVLGADIG